MFEKIKNIFKIKKGYMSENKEDISVDILNRRFANHDFQWIKGENLMNVVHYKNIVQQDDQFFICFSDGTRINYEILEEYMTWFPSQRKEVKPQPQVTQPTTQSQASVSSIKFGDSPNVISEASQSPIYNLLARQKKKPVEIELKIKVPLPSKDLFNVLTSSFDDAETEIIQFIIDSIDIDDIRNTLSKSIRENYYGTSSAKTAAPKESTKKQKQENEE
jgi:hypothetical protein